MLTIPTPANKASSSSKISIEFITEVCTCAHGTSFYGGLPDGYGLVWKLTPNPDERRTATSALRFLLPQSWSVVDWRTAAMLSFLDKSNGDVDHALLLAKGWKSNDLRDAYDVIDENAACAYNQMYRARRATPSFPRTSDVEMALFGLSMRAWPFR